MREASPRVASNGALQLTARPTFSGPVLLRRSLSASGVVRETTVPCTTSRVLIKEMLATIFLTEKVRLATRPIAIKQGPQMDCAIGIGEGSPSLAAARLVLARSSLAALIGGWSRRIGRVPIRGAV